MSLQPWVEHLPGGWEAKPLRSIAEYVVSNVDKASAGDETPVRLCNYTDVYNNEFITLALDFMEATASEAEIAKFGVAVGDVIITKDSESWDDIGVPALVTESASDLVCGYHLALLRPLRQKIDGSFLFRCFQAKPIRLQLELAANGITRFGVAKSEIGTMKVPVPPLPRQRAIADYLDTETARLDELVAAKERVLRLLSEKRRALVTRGVTRGLEACGPLRDSGIPWLGKIPTHWKLQRAKFLFQQSALLVRDDDEMVTCFRDGQVTLRRNRREEGFTNANLELGYQGIRSGQLVLHSMDAFAGAIGVSDSDGKCSPEYIICDRRNPEIDSYYYGHLLRIMALAGFIQASCPAVRERAPRIRFSEFGEMYLPVPPLSEQRAIVEQIGSDRAQLEALQSGNARTIALLKERRGALIGAAVTGQLGAE